MQNMLYLAEQSHILAAPSTRHQPPTCDAAIIEIAAQALFEFVFSRTERFDSMYTWENSYEATKQGFREEALVVIEALWPFFVF